MIMMMMSGMVKWIMHRAVINTYANLSVHLFIVLWMLCACENHEKDRLDKNDSTVFGAEAKRVGILTVQKTKKILWAIRFG